MEEKPGADDAPSGPELPELMGDDADLARRFPLPPGAVDAIVNKKLLAHALDVSATTIDSWIVAGLPSVRKGTNGQSYEFRLSVCYAWAQDRQSAQARAEAEAVDAAAQLRLSLLGGAVADASKVGLSTREQEEILKLEYAGMQAARERRELIRAGEVADAFEAAFAKIRDGLDAAPDLLARELGLDGEGIEAAQKILDGILQRAAAEVERLIAGE